MTIAERIFEKVRALPETLGRAVLAFVSALRARQETGQSERKDTSIFDRFGAVYDGPMNRDDVHDRQVRR
jgi:hypothetical protein